MKNHFLINLSFVLGAVFFFNTVQAQGLPTIKVDGNEVLVGAEGTLPLWLKSGQTLEIGTNTKYISVLEFTKDALSGGGNSLIFEDVVIVSTPAATVPNGKVWKVEATGLDKNSTLASTLITQGNNCEPPSNIVITDNHNKTITISWTAPVNPPAYGYLLAVMPGGVGPTGPQDFVTITGATTYTTATYSTTGAGFGLIDDIDVYIVASCNLNSQSNPISDDVTLTCQYDQLYHFTNCSQTGQTGPSQIQCNNAYSGTTLDNGGLTPVTVTSGIQTWTVPATGAYDIEVAGSKGGGSINAGDGAVIKGIVILTQNDILKILVGQQGESNGNQGGGGGGSFVVNNTTGAPYIVAGGGGGNATNNNGSYSNGATSTTGNSSEGIGGTNGNGGAGGPSYGAGGGGGFYGNGTNGNNSYYGYGGLSFTNGGNGGNGYSSRPKGGFGGGGGGEGWNSNSGGGGGGYSGGGGGSGGGGYKAGGGGGSYVISSASNVATADGRYNGTNIFNGGPIINLGAFNSGQGYVKIRSIICP